TRFSRDWSSDVCSSDLGASLNPYSVVVPSLTVGEDDSYDIIFSGTWSFPIQLPGGGWVDFAQHSFETRLIGFLRNAGATGTQTITTGGADSGAAIRYILRPVAEDSGTDDLEAGDLVGAAPVLGSPALGQVHELGASGVTAGPPSLGTP